MSPLFYFTPVRTSFGLSGRRGACPPAQLFGTAHWTSCWPVLDHDQLRFTNFVCRWLEPCFLRVSFTETWRDTPVTAVLDVFSPRTDAIEVGYVIQALAKELRPLWDGVAHAGDFLHAQEQLRNFMVGSLASFRAGSNPPISLRDFQKVSLAKVLDSGPELVAFYYALVPDTNGRNSLRLRAHTLRHAEGSPLWFEQRMSVRLPPERLVAAAAQVLSKLPKRFEPAIWLSQLAHYSPWAVEQTVPANPQVPWTGQKPVSFIIGPPGLPWASVFERSEIRGTIRRDDWIVVTTSWSNWVFSKGADWSTKRGVSYWAWRNSAPRFKAMTLIPASVL